MEEFSDAFSTKYFHLHFFLVFGKISAMNMKRSFILSLCFFLISGFAVSQDSSLIGTWENGGRFVEFSHTADSELNMKIVLKPYYTYVYEPLGNFSTTATPVANFKGLHILKITYPRMKQSVYMPICLLDNFLFTSFFQRNDYTSSETVLPESARPFGISDEQAAAAGFGHESPLYGFWTEQGTRDGILLYANDPPEYFDAYFFTDTEYFKFRYWKDDLENTEKQATFTDANGVSFSIPRIMTRGKINYACVTANASVLRNYEKGTYQLKFTDGTYYITLTPTGAGPGAVASKDTYEHAKYPEVINLPLYLTEDGKIFSYGEPFLFKTDIADLDAEISAHNAMQKPPVEPQLVPDDIDYYRERIKELEQLVPQEAGAAEHN